MIGELERNREGLYIMKDKFKNQVNRVKELIISISDNKKIAEELSNLLFELGGDLERVNSAIVDNKKAMDLLHKAKSLS